MSLKIRVSPLVREWLGKGIVAERNPSERIDITIIASQDWGEWVINAHRRLRPHMVRNAQEASEVWEFYDRMQRESGDSSDADS